MSFLLSWSGGFLRCHCIDRAHGTSGQGTIYARQARRNSPPDRCTGNHAPGAAGTTRQRATRAASDPGACSRTSFEDEVERRLGGAPDAAEAGLAQDVAQARFASLRAEREPDLLRERRRRADER